jgi:Fungal specific transcription factor domain
MDSLFRFQTFRPTRPHIPASTKFNFALIYLEAPTLKPVQRSATPRDNTNPFSKYSTTSPDSHSESSPPSTLGLSPPSIPGATPPPTEDRNDPFRGLLSSDDEALAETSDITNLSSFLTNSTPQVQPQLPMALYPYEDEQESISYFNFFLAELSKCFPYVNLFPWTAAQLFSTSTHHPALRQSVLAVAALIAEPGPQRGHVKALHHLQKALLQLQTQISSNPADEGIAISSFLLAHFSMMLGDFETSKRHLEGMLITLMKLDPQHSPHGVAVPLPLSVDKLTMLIYRMAIRVDFISSVACGVAPILPRYFSVRSL